jgi:hypothetical protein
MTIREKILEKKKTMLMELLSNDKTTSNEVQELALAAINAGPGSDEWQTYMKLFAENEQQLNRLMAKDGTQGQPNMDRARAYLIADGPCGTDTVTNFGNNTTVILDKDLNPTPNA